MTDLTEMMDAYHKQLLGHPQGQEHLGAMGITLKGIEEFSLGWVVEPLIDTHESLIGLPVFPYVSVTGRVYHARYSAAKLDGFHRYRTGVFASEFPLSTPEVHLYNVRHALPGLRTNKTVLVEDVLSCIKGRQERLRCVAAPGYDNWYDPWFELFRESDVTLVTNEARLDVTRPVMTGLRRRGIRHETVVLPESTTLSSVLDHPEDLEDVLELHRYVQSEDGL